MVSVVCNYRLSQHAVNFIVDLLRELSNFLLTVFFSVFQVCVCITSPHLVSLTIST